MRLEERTDLTPDHINTGGVEYGNAEPDGTFGPFEYEHGPRVNALNHEGDFDATWHPKKHAPQTEHTWAPLARPDQWQPVTTPNGTDAEVDLIGFNAKSVVVYNLTPQFVYLPDLRVWVDPFRYGLVLRLPSFQAANVARLQWRGAPPGFTQPGAISGAQCVTIWTESELAPSSGDTIGNTPVATKSLTVSGAHTPADATANPTDAVDATSFGMVWNGTTWDRVREGNGDGLTTGIVGAGSMVNGGGNVWNRLGTPALAGDANNGNTTANVQPMLFNGTTWDRMRETPGTNNAIGGTGISTATPMLWMGSGYQQGNAANANPSTGVGRQAVATGVAATQSLNAVIITGAGTSVDLGVCVANASIEIVATAVTTGGTMLLEGSLEGTNWSTLSTTTISANGNKLVGTAGVPVRFLRANLSARTDGTYSAWVAGA